MDSKEAKRRPGRPPRDPSGLPPASIGLRAPRALRARLEAAAAETGRSLSTEAQFRLEESFKPMELMETLFGGPAGLKLAMLLYASFSLTSAQRAAAQGHPEWTADQWLTDVECFERAVSAQLRSVWQHHPEGKDLLGFLEEEYRSALSRSASQEWNAQREAEAASTAPPNRRRRRSAG